MHDDHGDELMMMRRRQDPMHEKEMKEAGDIS